MNDLLLLNAHFPPVFQDITPSWFPSVSWTTSSQSPLLGVPVFPEHVILECPWEFFVLFFSASVLTSLTTSLTLKALNINRMLTIFILLSPRLDLSNSRLVYSAASTTSSLQNLISISKSTLKTEVLRFPSKPVPFLVFPISVDVNSIIPGP